MGIKMFILTLEILQKPADRLSRCFLRSGHEGGVGRHPLVESEDARSLYNEPWLNDHSHFWVVARVIFTNPDNVYCKVYSPAVGSTLWHRRGP